MANSTSKQMRRGWGVFKDWVRNNMLSISLLFTVAGSALALQGFYGLALNDLEWPVLHDLYLRAGTPWSLMNVIMGVIFLIFGLPYLVDLLNKRKEFNRLLESDSRAVIKKNIEQLEEIAYILGRKYVARLEAKKRELKMRKRK